MKQKVEYGVILPTWPLHTAVLKLEGEAKLTVLQFDELHSVNHAHEGAVGGPYKSKEEAQESRIPPHQQRVIDEKCQLDTRLQALRKFIGTSDVFETLHENEQQRLRHQLDAMAQYSSILAERIESFPVA